MDSSCNYDCLETAGVHSAHVSIADML
jgi:hypothetical protein